MVGIFCEDLFSAPSVRIGVHPVHALCAARGRHAERAQCVPFGARMSAHHISRVRGVRAHGVLLQQGLRCTFLIYLLI